MLDGHFSLCVVERIVESTELVLEFDQLGVLPLGTVEDVGNQRIASFIPFDMFQKG